MADCEHCNDTGYVCIGCGEADGGCVCDDGPVLEECDNCGDWSEDD